MARTWNPDAEITLATPSNNSGVEAVLTMLLLACHLKVFCYASVGVPLGYIAHWQFPLSGTRRGSVSGLLPGTLSVYSVCFNPPPPPTGDHLWRGGLELL